MVVIGVDPGMAATGFGVVRLRGGATHCVDAGVIRPPGRGPLALRLLDLHRRVGEIIDQHRPHEVAVESLFHARSPRTGIVLGHARGVILLAAAERGAHVAEYTPREIKQAVTGRGAASKDQVQAMLARLLGLPTAMDLDASDALAVALCHIQRACAGPLTVKA